MEENKKLGIAFAQWTYDNNFEETKLCIERVSPHVDYTIIVYDEPINPKSLEWIDNNITKYNIHLIKHEFKDDFPESRNTYIKKAKELKVDWMCVSDPDELYSEELAKNLRTLIKKYESEGHNNIAVPVRDEFIALGDTEHLDKLDELKESPAGRETNYWKPMLIFKLFDDIRYEGVGIEKNVHEMLMTRWKMVTVNLPKEYYYVHKKSSLKIWRNAARNMFISGGGDNVGAKNHLWTELRHLCSQIGINKWEEFEDFVGLGIDKYLDNYYLSFPDNIDKNTQKDKIKTEFRLWLEAALKATPTKEGTETRETSKWYYALHKDEIDKRIQDLIDKVPELSEELEVENFVTQMYYKILGRHPDESGKNEYTKRIIERKLKRSDFIETLQNSEEYKQRFGNSITKRAEINTPTLNKDVKYENFNEYDETKYKKVEDFVTRLYIKILGREPDETGKRYYTKAVMDKIIKLSELPSIFRGSDEYTNSRVSSISGVRNSRKSSRYGNVSKISKHNLKHEKTGVDSESINTVALCIMGYHDGIPMIKESIQVMKDSVDEIHIQGDNFTDEDVKELQSIDKLTQIHIEPWNDDFSDYKNKATSHAETEWIVICDHDEIPTEEMAKEIPNIIKSSDRGNNYDMVSFDVIDVRTIENEPISEVRNRGGKALLHWNIPNPYIGNPHIWLKEGYYPWKQIHCNIPYKHVKDIDTELERSVRNIFMGGGGDNSKEKNSNWVELRKVCSDIGINTWEDFNNYLKRGNIDNNTLSVLKKLNEMMWKDNELKDVLRYYYLMHPHEKNRVMFGDNISWDNHVYEIIERNKTKGEVIFYKYDEFSEIPKHILNYIPDCKDKKLLDCGCHMGRWSEFFTGMGFDYTGIDQSNHAIETAKEYQSSKSNIKFINSFLWDMNFNQEFDIAITIAALQHNKLEEQEKIVPKIYNALKSDGLYFMTESTEPDETKTQRTYDGWIKFIESFGFKFLESWHKNEYGMDDHYIFRKV